MPPAPTFHASFALQRDQAIDYVTTHLLDKQAAAIVAMSYFFKAYATDGVCSKSSRKAH